MAPDILVIAEAAGGKEPPSTQEVCHVAHDLARQTGWSWAKLVVEQPVATSGGVALFAETAAAAAREARLVLMGATAVGKDAMARVAGHLRVPLAQDCTGYRLEEGTVVFTRPLHGGKVFADVHLAARPALATFRPRAQPAFAGMADVLTQVARESASHARVRTELREAGVGRSLDVAEADIVVSGGRGMQGPEHWHLLESLVHALGPRAALACSRPVSDEGWRPRAEHVGQTGRAIAPDVYVACGISGAIQHVAGITGSKCIIAINRDADAPIFKVADYGIVGDLFEVVPALTQAIKALKGS